jgi:hypothetical protein
MADPTGAVYDPSTGQWLTYTPPAATNTSAPLTYAEAMSPQYWGQEETASPSTSTASSGGTFTPVAAPADAGSASYLVDPTQTDPNAIASQLLQSQFNQWQSEYAPIELQAMQDISFNNPSVLSTALTQADQIAQGENSTMAGVLQRQNAEAGIQPTAQQQAVQNRTINLQQALNIASGENTARQNVSLEDEELLLGTAPSPSLVSGMVNSGA